MSKDVVRFVEVPCSAPDEMLDAPSFVRVRLDADTVRLLEELIRAEKAQEYHGKGYVEFVFPESAMEYLQGCVEEHRRRWGGEFCNTTVSPAIDRMAFQSEVLNRWGDRAEHVLSTEVGFDRLEQELRHWRSEVMGQSIEEAMPAESTPALRSTSGMSPL